MLLSTAIINTIIVISFYVHAPEELNYLKLILAGQLIVNLIWAIDTKIKEYRNEK